MPNSTLQNSPTTPLPPPLALPLPLRIDADNCQWMDLQIPMDVSTAFGLLCHSPPPRPLLLSDSPPFPSQWGLGKADGGDLMKWVRLKDWLPCSSLIHVNLPIKSIAIVYTRHDNASFLTTLEVQSYVRVFAPTDLDVFFGWFCMINKHQLVDNHQVEENVYMDFRIQISKVGFVFVFKCS